MRGVGRVKRMLRQVRRRLAPAAVILTYHRVAHLAVDPYGITVSPDHFARHVEYIRQKCHPMPLLELVRRTSRGRSLPTRPVVVTLDDGYVDVYSQAYPILAANQIPATVFVTSGYVGRDSRFWSDELTHILLLQDRLPSALRLEVQGTEYEWSTTTLQERQLAHGALYRLLKPLPPAVQSEKLASLARWAGLGRTDPAEDRAMNPSELFQLTRNGLVDVGGHTIHHPALSSLPADEQHDEIVGGRQALEASTGRPVLTFAYPYGGPQDFTDQTAATVEAAGFEAACTTVPGVVSSRADPFRLPRCWVGDWDEATFAKNLEWYLLQ